MDILARVISSCTVLAHCSEAQNHIQATKKNELDSRERTEAERGTLTPTGPVRQLHVTVQAVALVAPVRVHAPVFTGPRLQTALVQVCRQKEGE